MIILIGQVQKFSTILFFRVDCYGFCLSPTLFFFHKFKSSRNGWSIRKVDNSNTYGSDLFTSDTINDSLSILGIRYYLLTVKFIEAANVSSRANTCFHRHCQPLESVPQIDITIYSIRSLQVKRQCRFYFCWPWDVPFRY